MIAYLLILVFYYGNFGLKELWNAKPWERKRQRVITWPTVKTNSIEIIRYANTSYGKDGGTKLRYHYIFRGNSYVSTSIAPFPVTSTKNVQQAIKQQAVENGPLYAYINPKAPEEAYLSAGIQQFGINLLAKHLFILFLFPAFCLFWVYFHYADKTLLMKLVYALFKDPFIYFLTFLLVTIGAVVINFNGKALAKLPLAQPTSPK